MIASGFALLQAVFPLVFTSNIVLAAVKYLAKKSLTSTGLRVILGFVAVLGVLAQAVFTGTPVDFDSVSALAYATLEVALTGVLAHFSYKAIKKS